MSFVSKSGSTLTPIDWAKLSPKARLTLIPGRLEFFAKIRGHNSLWSKRTSPPHFCTLSLSETIVNLWSVDKTTEFPNESS